MTATVAGAADVLMRDYMALEPGETVVITADTDSDREVWQAIHRASLLAGANSSVMLIPPLPYQGRLADPYLTPAVSAAALAADVWIDLTFPYLAGSELHDQAMEGNHIRYLLGADLNAGGLLRLFGRVDLDRYFAVHHAFDALVNDAEGKPVRITDGGGTDVSFTLGERGFSKPRRADKPGTVLVPGQCTLFPEVESVKGRIEIGAIFHEYYTSLAAPMTLEIDGRIRAVSGGGNERTVDERAPTATTATSSTSPTASIPRPGSLAARSSRTPVPRATTPSAWACRGGIPAAARTTPTPCCSCTPSTSTGSVSSRTAPSWALSHWWPWRPTCSRSSESP